MRRRQLDDVESRLVWILGGPRTGSTWLLNLLVHPLASGDATPSGVERRPLESGVTPAAIPINEPYIGVHLAPIQTSGTEPGSVFTAADARAGDPSYLLDERFAHAWRPQLRRLILERLAAQAELAEREHDLKRPLIVVKEPNGSHAAEPIASTLPRSRLLFLLRDGRDVLDSLLDAASPGGWLAGGPGGEHLGSAQARIAFLQRHATLWLHRIEAMQRALAGHARELSLTIRYEDLLAVPESQLTRITAWLGREADEEALAEAVAANSFGDYPDDAKGRGKPLRAASPGGWRQNLSAEEQAAMLAVMGAKLEELGY